MLGLGGYRVPAYPFAMLVSVAELEKVALEMRLRFEVSKAASFWSL